MKIRNVVHKGLRRLIEDDDAGGLQPAVVEKVRRIISFLQDMAGEAELRTVANWKAHQLTGDQEGNLEPVRDEELATDISDRPRRDRDHRPGL